MCSLIILICFFYRHSGVNISLGLDAMIESMGLEDERLKLWSVNDNASNMHVAIRESKYLEELNCGIHTLALAVSDTFKEVQGMKKVLKKAKRLAAYAHNEGPKNQLKKAVLSAGLKFRKPKCPGETRWSSQLDCMSSLQPYKDVFDAMSTESLEWERRNLSKQQWKLLEGACSNLKPLKDTILAWEGENEPTIDRVVERLYINHNILDNFLMDPKNQREKSGVLFAKKLKDNIERRFPGKGTHCEIYCRANYLNPVFKGIHLMDAERLEEVKQKMEEEWQSSLEHERSVSLGDGQMPPPLASLSPTSQLRLKIGTMAEFKMRQKTNDFKKEVDRYESFNICAKNESVRAWWKKFGPTLPILSGFARSVLAIPASSAKSERAFSKGGNIVTRKRTRLNPKKVEEIVVIQENTEKVAAFLQKTTYEVKKTGRNIFAGIDIKEIVRRHEEEEEASEDSDDGVDAFDSKSDDADGDKYESDDFSISDDDVE